ncbi:beta-lactamase family protein [Methylobacterium sp. J-030]|uniref:serine hydrolase domain-containing protein n=1 Tax=Methylobacterium sp. J-030 TaxID=2836627 RepID=UPI001FBBE91F|nr:beta-lactamase family protein [Methylobacterium sp. J-030]
MGRERIDAVLRRGIETGRLAGVVAVAATERGVLYEGAFGRRSVTSDDAMTLDTVFWIASMTKALTTAAALQLVERGKLSLHAPAGDLLPELRAPEVLEGFDAGGAPRLRPARGPVTLHHLLTHTSGFTYPMWNADHARYAAVAGLPDLGSCRKAALLAPLAFDPGTRWAYGIGLDWAGLMVERASGQRLDSYLRHHVLTPLGMADTGFVARDDWNGRLAGMHARQPDGSLKAIDFRMPAEPEVFMGGGGLYATAPDYLRFCRAIMHGGLFDGSAILSPASVASMCRDQIAPISVERLRTADAALSNDAEFFPGIPKGWSYGFMTNGYPTPTGRSAGGLSWAGLANTYVWIDPVRKVTGVILMQLLPFADEPALETYESYETAANELARSV